MINSLLVIITIIFILCVGIIIGRCSVVYHSDNTPLNDDSRVRSMITRGGAATELLTDKIKRNLVFKPFALQNGLPCSMPCGYIDRGDVAFANHIEIYMWLYNGFPFIKCGVEGSSIKNDYYDTKSEFNARLSANIRQSAIAHSCVMLAPSDVPHSGAYIGLCLTLYEQIGHALVAAYMHSISPDYEITALSHTAVSTWPKSDPSNSGECFTFRNQFETDAFTYNIPKTITRIITAGSNGIMVYPSDIANGVYDHNSEIFKEVDINTDTLMFQMIAQYMNAATKIIEFYRCNDNCANDNPIYTIDQNNWAKIWSCARDNPTESIENILSKLSDIVDDYDTTFQKNGAVNILNCDFTSSVNVIEPLTVNDLEMFINDIDPEFALAVRHLYASINMIRNRFGRFIDNYTMSIVALPEINKCITLLHTILSEMNTQYGSNASSLNGYDSNFVMDSIFNISTLYVEYLQSKLVEITNGHHDGLLKRCNICLERLSEMLTIFNGVNMDQEYITRLTENINLIQHMHQIINDNIN